MRRRLLQRLDQVADLHGRGGERSEVSQERPVHVVERTGSHGVRRQHPDELAFDTKRAAETRVNVHPREALDQTVERVGERAVVGR